MARKPGRQSKPGVFKPRPGHRTDRRKFNKGVGMDKLVQLRVDVLNASAPDEKVFRSKSAYKFAQRQLKGNGVRYQVFNTGGGEYVAVKIDTPVADVRASSEFKRVMRVLKNERDRSKRGPLHRALVELGLRDSSFDWAVGDTND